MLTSKQRAFLKSEAHSLKPIVQIGKKWSQRPNQNQR
ncbi:CRS1 / YhbY domain protein [Streptococcus mutans]|nr:CRS1 / YhbY domain protein [Streptococcus mutans]